MLSIENVNEEIEIYFGPREISDLHKIGFDFDLELFSVPVYLFLDGVIINGEIMLKDLFN